MEESTKTEEGYIRAIVTMPGKKPSLELGEIRMPVAAPNQALIKVTAFSLNQGETRTALAANSRYVPGWDFAGVVEKAAADGSTPGEGARVFGYVYQGSWAEYLVAPINMLAEIPDGVSDEQAASLPVAGLTALACLDASGDLLDRRVLITGAAGGVGRFACQLAASAGAKVFVVSSRNDLIHQLKKDGVTPAGIFATVAEAKVAGNYDIAWDAVGGDTLAIALTSLARNGLCINYGNSARQPTTFNVRTPEWPFHGIQCIWFGREPVHNNTPMLIRLADLIKQGHLYSPIQEVLPWTSVANAAERLVNQSINGKVVLKVV